MNGVLQRSVLKALLLNIFSELPTAISRKYAYAYDLEIIPCLWRLTNFEMGAKQ